MKILVNKTALSSLLPPDFLALFCGQNAQIVTFGAFAPQSALRTVGPLYLMALFPFDIVGSATICSERSIMKSGRYYGWSFPEGELGLILACSVHI